MAQRSRQLFLGQVDPPHLLSANTLTSCTDVALLRFADSGFADAEKLALAELRARPWVVTDAEALALVLAFEVTPLALPAAVVSASAQALAVVRSAVAPTLTLLRMIERASLFVIVSPE